MLGKKLVTNRQTIAYASASAALLLLALGYTIFTHNRVERLKMGVGDRQSASYKFAQNLSELVKKYNPKIQIELVPTEGSLQNIELLEKGEIQLGTAQADVINSPSTRLITYLFSDKYQLVVTEKSGIKKISDLKGKRIALPPEGSGQYRGFEILASHYGLKPQEYQVKLLSEDEGDLAFSRNEVDAVFRVRVTGNPRIKILVQKYRGQLIPIDQGEAMRIDSPALSATVIPKGAYRGESPIPPEDLPTVAIERNLLTRDSVNSDTIREITRILFERQAELADKMPIAASINPPTAISKLGAPIHPGAQAYYDREKPSFVQENADYLGLILTIGALFGSWSLALKNSWQKARKNRADIHNQDIVAIIFSVQESDNLDEILQIRRQLNDIFRQVVFELDKDKISAESFESFSFAWQAAIAAVRDRENLLRSEFKSKFE